MIFIIKVFIGSLVLFGVFLLLKRGTARSIRFSSHISKFAIRAFLFFIIFYIVYTISDISKFNIEGQSNTEAKVESVTEKDLINSVVLFFVNIATLLGLYHILDENRKKNQPKIEEEKREIVKLQSTIRLLQEELNTKKQQKFYEGYYEEN